MATWIGADGNYHTAANWNPADVPGDAPGETATFTNTGSTSVTISSDVGPGGFTFDAGAPTYTISLSGSGTTLAFGGAGIDNNSGVAQNLATATGGVLSAILFLSNSTADDATITINSLGQLSFFDTSSGGSARIIGNGGALVLATSSGTLSIGSLEGSGTVTASNSAGGAATNVLTVGSLGTDTTFSGNLQNGTAAVGLTKVGSGTLTLSGSNSYTLATTINGGTLQVDGALVLSTTTVNSGGTLGGDGSVHDVIVNSGGHVAPGASPGSLVTADFTLNAGASLDIEVGGTTAGTQYDQLIVVGTVTLTGTLTSRLIDGFNPANGATFTIIDNDSNDAVNGIFSGLSEGEFFTHNGSSYSISYVGGTGNDVVVTAANDAPVITLDGDLDALVANGGSNNVSVLIGDGVGGFTAQPTPVGVGSDPISVALGDVDGDGDLDALVANPGSNNVSVLIGDGMGGFAVQPTPVNVGNTPFSVALGDVNGDGDLDALVANAIDNNVSVLIGDGTGVFTPATAVGADNIPVFVALGDVDGDGDLDALVANASSDNVSVLIGNGAGGFTAATPVGVGDQPRSVALGDVDGDGDLDALVANDFSANVSVLIGNGAGGFTVQPTPVGAGTRPAFVALGDVDGDGNLDALVANENSANVSVLIGNGAGGFTAATPVGVGARPQSVALGDVDGDGDLDALVANVSSNNVSVLIGNGAGGFTAAAAVVSAFGPRSVALGDIDNAQVTNEDTAFVFNAANGNAITLSDDAGVDETLTLEVENGILTLATLAGLTGVSGDGTATVTFTGTLAEINAALNGLSYAPDEHFNGRDTLTVTANDNASAAAGGAKTATKLVPIIVNAVDDPIVARDDDFFQDETFGINANILVNNPDGDAFSVTAVNGVAANVGQQITLASGATLRLNADGTFVYDPNGAFDALPAAGSGASNLTATDSFTYTITGGSTATITITITGIDSDDILRGTVGNDALAGGIGNDSYFVENAGDAITEIAGQGSLDRVLARVSYVLGAGDDIEMLTTTNSLGTGAINLGGNQLAQTIYGNAGMNTLNGEGGNDILSGFGGNDVLNGGAGDDKLYGGAGQNNLSGGLGNDSYIVDSLTDVIIEAAGQGTRDRVFTTLNYTLTAGAHVEIMSPTTIFTAAINLTGNELANTIYGNSNVNVLNGAAGNDVLVGLGGTDTLNGGDGDDRLMGGDGTDSLNGGTGTDSLFGESGNDILNGGIGDDRLVGGVGQNTLTGGTGNDVYIVSSASDTVTDLAGQGTVDRVYTSVSFTLAANAQIEFLAADPIAGTAPINLTGNAFANTIYGNNGANVISGKGGNDLLVGRGGGDTFVFDTLPHATANRDIIGDFDGAQDTIRLAKSVFSALTGNAGNVLSADQFVVGPRALDANDRIIYSNGALSYDNNGNLDGGVTLIAVLSGRPSLSNTDIVLG